WIVLNGEVIAAQLRTPHTDINTPLNSYRTNLDPEQYNTAHSGLAVRPAGAIRLMYPGVDIIIDDKGTTHILEVNTAPGLHFFGRPHAGIPHNVAEQYLHAIIDTKSINVISGDAAQNLVK